MGKISYLKINGFRSFNELTLKDLSRINIIVGENNSGKTSLLECIELACYPLNINHLITTSLSRDRFNRFRYTRLEYISWLFPKQDFLSKYSESKDIDIIIKIDNNYSRYLASYKETKVIENIVETLPIYNDQGEVVDAHEDTKSVEVNGLDVYLANQKSLNNEFDCAPLDEKNYSLTRNSRVSIRLESLTGLIPTNKVTPSDHRLLPISAKFLSEVILEGDKPKILSLLRLFDDDIDGFELINLDEFETVPYLNHRTLGYAPVSVFGDGLRRALTLASALIKAENGALFIDEIETAFHAKLLEKVFSWVITACHELNVQLFATTHSLEAIDAILSVDKDHIEELAAYRLELKDGKHKVKRFSGTTLYDLRHELGQDVR